MEPHSIVELLLQSLITGGAAWFAIKVELRFLRTGQEQLWRTIRHERKRFDEHLAKHADRH